MKFQKFAAGLFIIFLFMGNIAFSHGDFTIDCFEGQHDYFKEDSATVHAPSGLLCELKSRPIGIEARTPCFSWVMRHTGTDQVQTAYQVLVATSLKKLEAGSGDMWDSGKVLSGRMSNVPYGDKALRPASVYYWKVRVWDKADSAGPYSCPQMFITALWDQWQAMPIWAASDGFVYLRKQIKLPMKPIERAVVYVTAKNCVRPRNTLKADGRCSYQQSINGVVLNRLLGAYRLYINGREIGIGPGLVRDKHTHPYDVFDVSEVLKAGAENVLAVQGYALEDPGFMLQMKLFYRDSTTQTIVTDASWKAFDANPIFNPTGNKSGRGDFYQPHENIDARLIPVGWRGAGFDDSGWSNVVEREKFPRLIAKDTYPLELHEQTPVSVVDKGDGCYFFDFGKEIMGGIRLTIDGQSGRRIEVRLGEELSAPNTVMYKMRTENLYHDTWTLRDGPQTIGHHEYSTFRYGEILNSPSRLTAENIKAWVVRYPFGRQESAFNSSNQVLNDVWDFCKYTIKATTLDSDVDCHSRERLAYECDSYYTALARYSTAREWLMQRYTTEHLFEFPSRTNAGVRLTDWTIYTIRMVYADYMETGDLVLARRYFNVLKKNTYRRFLNEDGLLEKPDSAGFDIIDWPQRMLDGYQHTPISTAINACAYRSLELLAKMADVLQFKEDAEQLRAESAALAKAINKHLFNGTLYKDGKELGHTALHANIYPLAFGLVPSDRQPGVVAFVKTKGMKCAPYAGFYLLEGLYNMGEDQAALELLTAKTGNSWGHMIYDLHATTTTEAWDPSQKPNMTWSHPYAAYTAFFFRTRVMGITPLEPGYHRIQIKPQPGNLQRASMDAPTIRGTVHVDFSQKPGEFLLNVDIPANTLADVYLPVPDADDIIVLVDGVQQTGTRRGKHVCLESIGSGAHAFKRIVAREDKGGGSF